MVWAYAILQFIYLFKEVTSTVGKAYVIEKLFCSGNSIGPIGFCRSWYMKEIKNYNNRGSHTVKVWNLEETQKPIQSQTTIRVRMPWHQFTRSRDPTLCLAHPKAAKVYTACGQKRKKNKADFIIRISEVVGPKILTSWTSPSRQKKSIRDELPETVAR